MQRIRVKDIQGRSKMAASRRRRVFFTFAINAHCIEQRGRSRAYTTIGYYKCYLAPEDINQPSACDRLSKTVEAACRSVYLVPDFPLTMSSGVIRLLFWPVMFVRGRGEGGGEGESEGERGRVRGKGGEEGRWEGSNGKDTRREGKRDMQAGRQAGI